MDNDKAIADVIAALERARDWIDAHHFDEEASTSEIEEIYQRQVKETVAQADIALASLRAVAPAPADQSDAAETGVEEFLFDWSSFPKEIYVRSVMSRHLMTEFRCVAAKLGAEPEVKYLRSDLAPSSDAGRDGVPSSRQEIALHFCTHKWTASERSIDPTIACEPCCKKADTIIRALARAPSETVGPGGA